MNKATITESGLVSRLISDYTQKLSDLNAKVNTANKAWRETRRAQLEIGESSSKIENPEILYDWKEYESLKGKRDLVYQFLIDLGANL